MGCFQEMMHLGSKNKEGEEYYEIKSHLLSNSGLAVKYLSHGLFIGIPV